MSAYNEAKNIKRPAFLFYPADWLRDTALRTCSITARGLWMDMICYMHQGKPYGYLKVNRKAIQPAQLAIMVGLPLEDTIIYLKELKEAGVYSVKSGVIYSRRMVRDEHIRSERAKAGKKGGNPNLLKQKVNQISKQNLTPSISSSVSNTINNIEEHTARKTFAEAWQLYDGQKRELDTEWENFRAKYQTNSHELCPQVLKGIQNLLAWRREAEEHQIVHPNFFIPGFPYFATWINTRRWEAKLPPVPVTLTNTKLNSIETQSVAERLERQSQRI